MTSPRSLERLKAKAPGFFSMLGGDFRAVDPHAGTCTLSFDIGKEFCHSGDVVQGGFITAMLDAAMSHAVFAADSSVVSLASLEISTRYIDVTRAGTLEAIGRIVRVTYKTAFLEGQLYCQDGSLLATTQTVAKLSRRKSE